MRYLIAVVGVLVPSLTLAQPKKRTAYDFVIVDQQCKMMIAPLMDVDPQKKDPVITDENSGTSNIYCSRAGKRLVRCEDPRATQTKLEYKIDIDTVALLRFSNATESEVIYINPSEHAAATLTRAFQTPNEQVPMLAAKMCKGYYLTYDEAEKLKKAKP